MQRNQLFRLRHGVGSTVAIESIVETSRSAQCVGFPATVEAVGGAVSLQTHPIFKQYLPPHHNFPGGNPGATQSSGMATLPLHPDLPFEENDPLWLIAMTGGLVQEDVSRQLWIEFRITLDPKEEHLIGGICYGGYPYLPYYTTTQGETSSNFGLPREIRVSWRTAGGSHGFIDDETGVTLQQPAAHSGIHILPVGPVSTNELILRLSDFPRIALTHRNLNPQQRPFETWGLLMPFLYVYRHKEQTRWKARVPAALLAAQQVPLDPQGTYYPMATSEGPMRGLSPDQLRPVPGPVPTYAVLSAASIFGPARNYSSVAGTEQEFFLSGELALNHQVRLFVEQTEQHERTIAGIRLGFAPLLHLTDYSVQIYECDPIEGVSPVTVDADPAKDKYCRKLFSGQYSNPQFPGNVGVFRFVRPSSSRYFVLVIANLGDSGRVALFKAELVQSASVEVSSRPSCRQHVHSLRYRLIGPDLGSDYSQLTRNGFGVTVEHIQAGRPKRVLFEAANLLELVESGSAQLIRNQRYLEPTVEISDLHAHTKGWRQAETGKDVNWSPGIVDDVQTSPDDGGPHLISFRSYGTNETRIHTRQVGFVGEDAPTEMLQDQVKTINEVIKQIAGATNSEYVTIPTLTSNPLLDSTATEFPFSWKGIDTDAIKQIRGLYHLNVPPFSLSTQFATNLISMLSLQATVPPPADLVNEFFRDAYLRTVLSGFSASFGLSLGYVFGGSGSISSGQMLPSASRVTTSGETGTIQIQGTQAAHQFSRHLNTSYDRTRHVRRVVRKEHERRGAGDVQWQGELVDIVTGAVSIGIRLPALGPDVYRTSDESIRVRFHASPGSSIRVDVWFDVVEEATRDDH